MTKSESACLYAANGLHVLPLHFIKDGRCSCRAGKDKCKPGKHPFGTFAAKGLKDATNDVEAVKGWWEREGRCNIGIRTGTISGIFVLDVDDRDGGSTSLAKLEVRHGALPKTLTQITGGGRHLIFNSPQGISIKNSQGDIGAGLDVRGDGGYIVAAPSDHESGAVYRFDSDTGFDRSKIADAPEWLINLCRKDQQTRKKTTTPRPASGTGQIHKIHDGQGREGFILQRAGELRAKGFEQPQIEEMLLALNIAKLDPPLPESAVLDRARRYETTAANDDEWPDPRELGEELMPVEPFNLKLLPAKLRDWVSDTSERMQAPVDFLAVGAMVGAGAVVGNTIGIQPKQSDFGWIEVPNLWGAIVGRPSSMKSPALAAMLGPVMSLEAKALQQFEAGQSARQFERAKYEADLKEFESKLKKGAATQQDMPIKPDAETQPRYVTNDTTFQKLGVLCAENPDGLLVFQDELSGLLEALSCQGQEGARGYYLTAWIGHQSYTFDRIGRGTTLIRKLCLSILGGFQPAKLREHIGGAVTGGKKDDGLAQRFQLFVYPDQAESWHYVDRPPQYDLLAVDEIFERLDSLDPIAIGAEDELGRDIPILKFDDEAQALFVKMLTNLEQRLRKGDLDPALESHLAKYRKLIPALALLIHLIDVGHGPVGTTALKKAWGWSNYLESHARRVYAVATGIKDRGTRSLMQLLESGALTDGFTAREVYRKGRSGLTRQEEAQEAIDALLELGWLRAVSDPIGSKPGRPSFRYVINPKIRRAA